MKQYIPKPLVVEDVEETIKLNKTIDEDANIRMAFDAIKTLTQRSNNLLEMILSLHNQIEILTELIKLKK